MLFEKEINFYTPDEIIKQFLASETSISVIQGKISAMISESELNELQNNNITMYSKLADAEFTLDKLRVDFSNLDTKYDVINNQYTSVNSKLAEYKLSIDGININVSSIEKDLHDNYSNTEEMMSAIKTGVDGLESSVSKTYATTAMLGNYSTTTDVESKILQRANEIKTEVSEFYTTKDEFNNLTVGTRNIIRNSTGLLGISNWQNHFVFNNLITKNGSTLRKRNGEYLYVKKNISNTLATISVEENITYPTYKQTAFVLQNQTVNPKYIFSDRFLLKSNTTYTFCGYVYVDEEANGIDISLLESDSIIDPNSPYLNYENIIPILNYTTKNQWHQFKISFTTGVSCKSGILKIIHSGVSQAELDGRVLFGSLKLEMSNGKASDWSPAPEDVESSVLSVSSQYTQLATKFSWVVKSGTSESDFEINDKFISMTSQALDIDALTTFKNSAENGTSTVIDGGSIKTKSLKSEQIDVNDLFAQSITATGSVSGGEFIGSIFKSKNYVPGSSGSIINMDDGTINIGDSLRYDGKNLRIGGSAFFSGIVKGSDISVGGNGGILGSINIYDKNDELKMFIYEDGIRSQDGGISIYSFGASGGSIILNSSSSTVSPKISLDLFGIRIRKSKEEVTLNQNSIDICDSSINNIISNKYVHIGIYNNCGTIDLSDPSIIDNYGISKSYFLANKSGVFCKSLTCTGFKNRMIKTKNYSNVLQYCYEMSSPMFGDIGSGITDETGECFISIDDIFTETANLSCEYYVFLQKEGQGELWVEEKTPTFFVVKGTPDLKFSWEIKSKQRDYEFERLETFDSNPDNFEEGSREQEYYQQINNYLKQEDLYEEIR